MSTTTRDEHVPEIDSIPDTKGRTQRLQRWFRVILVFVAGIASLTIEMAASRLLAPYFGSSLFVWSSLIGLILLYLTIGYYVGGLLSDRHPYPQFLYGITGLAAILIGLIPVIAHPVLDWTFLYFSGASLGVFYSSLASVIILFALPTILLGCVSPYAIRLSVNQIGHSGRTSGQLYAISTAGSIVGTFVPVLVLLPDLGTNLTFFCCALLLFVASLVPLLATSLPSRHK